MNLNPTHKSHTTNLDQLLASLSELTDDELRSNPRIENREELPNIDLLPIEARMWFRLDDVVAVASDLKNSTLLTTGSKISSTASVYEAVTGGSIEVYKEFDADFVQIQGDGGFAIFAGDNRYERAMCAAITLATNSRDLSQKIRTKWKNANKPGTGLKIGVASGPVLVKRVGIRKNSSFQEPVWPGKPVNYATKALQSAHIHEVVVTYSVWERIKKNDHLAFSCDCRPGPKAGIWTETGIRKIYRPDIERRGHRLRTTWCPKHGSEQCAAILDGHKKRDTVRRKPKKNQNH